MGIKHSNVERIIEKPVKKVSIIRKSSVKNINIKTWKHLVVDDVIDNRKILRGYLRNIGISSDEAANGEEVLTKDLSQYDVIWMDLRMPRMDGIECTRRIREIGNDIFIIAVTGDTSPYTGDLCRKNGFNMVLFKPIIRSEFETMKIIQQYLSNNNNSKLD